MGHQFRIEGDEAAALAEELAALTGQSVEAAVMSALHRLLAEERARRQELQKMKELVAAFTARLSRPLPSSDHGWLYDDETGLPV